MSRSKAKASDKPKDPAPSGDDPSTPHYDARGADGRFVDEDGNEQPGPAPTEDDSDVTPADENQLEVQAEAQAEGDDHVELEPLSKEDQQASIASSLGGTDNYAYVDRTEPRSDLMTTSTGTEASQAELNPAFYPKAEDGGPVHPETGEGIGTEPNAYEQTQAVLEEKDPEAAKAFEAQVEAGKAQQIDAEAELKAADERTPDDVDPATGQKE